MNRDNRFILVDHGPVVLQKGANNTVDFADVDEFNRYADSFASGALNNKTYLYYDPDNKVHIDSANNIDDWSGPVGIYENILASFDTIVERKNDPLYGLTGQDRAKMIQYLKSVDQWKQKKEFIEEARENSGIKDLIPAQVEAKINAAFNQATTVEEKLELIEEYIKKLSLASLDPSPPIPPGLLRRNN